jgi:hypothetical protein
MEKNRASFHVLSECPNVIYRDRIVGENNFCLRGF